MSRPSAASWHAERYAAGEALAKAARELLTYVLANPLLAGMGQHGAERLETALAEYERTRDAP